MSRIRRYHRPLFPSLLGLALLLLSASPEAQAQKKPAQESDEYFNSTNILTLDLTLGKDEMQSLRMDHRKNVKGTLREGDKVVYRDVAVHLKGAAGSFRGIDEKPNLTFNLDKFVEGQRFHGMDKFHLANSLQDPSYLSELICGELFRAAGVPAARVHHAVLKINGKPKGLYYVKEGYDRYFLKRHFGGTDGNFYDGGFLQDIDRKLELISGKDDVKDQADLKALVKAAREPNKDQRFRDLERLLDLDKFVSFIVMESVTWDWDGYPIKCNNYRIYHDPVKDKITFMPSGMDQMFHDPRGPALPHFQGLVARGLIDTPRGRELYDARMKEVLEKVFKVEPLLKRLDELEARVQPALASVDANAGKDYRNQVNRLRDGIRERHKALTEEFARMQKEKERREKEKKEKEKK